MTATHERQSTHPQSSTRSTSKVSSATGAPRVQNWRHRRTYANQRRADNLATMGQAWVWLIPWERNYPGAVRGIVQLLGRAWSGPPCTAGARAGCAPGRTWRWRWQWRLSDAARWVVPLLHSCAPTPTRGVRLIARVWAFWRLIRDRPEQALSGLGSAFTYLLDKVCIYAPILLTPAGWSCWV